MKRCIIKSKKYGEKIFEEFKNRDSGRIFVSLVGTEKTFMGDMNSEEFLGIIMCIDKEAEIIEETI